MEVDRFDKDAMAMFGLDPYNEQHIAEWLATEPRAGTADVPDYSQDPYEFGSPDAGQSE
jgi:hypothetical protein